AAEGRRRTQHTLSSPRSAAYSSGGAPVHTAHLQLPPQRRLQQRRGAGAHSTPSAPLAAPPTAVEGRRRTQHTFSSPRSAAYSSGGAPAHTAHPQLLPQRRLQQRRGAGAHGTPSAPPTAPPTAAELRRRTQHTFSSFRSAAYSSGVAPAHTAHPQLLPQRRLQQRRGAGAHGTPSAPSAAPPTAAELRRRTQHTLSSSPHSSRSAAYSSGGAPVSPAPPTG
ncbi:hypothetical protein chiPu_0031286, partial [Chiloscyllium punctatum]|nr:hypothetical protein [Chiloscyllium punctatum]